MGLGICKIHGESSMTMVCPHIEKYVEKRKVFQTPIVASFDLGEFPGEISTQLKITFTYCSKCVVELQLPNENCELTEERLDAINEDKLKTVCYKCFLELRS